MANRVKGITIISTNTLLAEGDLRGCFFLRWRTYFNQHPPRGG